MSKELKLLMTKVAKGELTQEEALEYLVKPEKTQESKPEKESEGKDTHKRKKTTKAGGKK